MLSLFLPAAIPVHGHNQGICRTFPPHDLPAEYPGRKRFVPAGPYRWDTIMSYLNWGCEPLAEECQSCLDAICNACYEEFKKKRISQDDPCGEDEDEGDGYEPDCDLCDPEKKPSCPTCEIILETCVKCTEHGTCD